VFLCMGILLFDPIAGLIIKRRVLNLTLIFSVGVVSSIIGIVFVQGFKMNGEGKNLNLGLYILFSCFFSLVFLWGVTFLWIDMLRVMSSFP